MAVIITSPSNFDTRYTPETTQNLTDAASIAWDVSLGTLAYVMIAGDRAMANPTNLRAGAKYVLFVQQDGIANRRLSWGTQYVWSNGRTPVLYTQPLAMNVFGFISDGVYLYGTADYLPDNVMFEDELVGLNDEVIYL